MTPISNGFGNSLDLLADVISKAEKKLSKLPGAALASIELDFGVDPRYPQVFYSLCYDDSEGICIAIIGHDGECEDRADVTALTDLPVAQRIKAAHFIPELLDEASSEEGLIQSCDEAVSAIEQTLAEME